MDIQQIPAPITKDFHGSFVLNKYFIMLQVTSYLNLHVLSFKTPYIFIYLKTVYNTENMILGNEIFSLISLYSHYYNALHIEHTLGISFRPKNFHIEVWSHLNVQISYKSRKLHQIRRN